MKATLQTVTTGAGQLLVDGSSGSQGRPVRAHIHPASGTVYLGGVGVTTANGFPLATADPPLVVELVSDKLYCAAGSSIVVQVLASGI